MTSMPTSVAHMNNLICEAFPHSDESEDVADSGHVKSFVLIKKYGESHGIWPSLINPLGESRLCQISLSRTPRPSGELHGPPLCG